MPIINEIALLALALHAVTSRSHEDFAQKKMGISKPLGITEAVVRDFPPILRQTDESDSFATQTLDLVSGVYHEFMRPEISHYGERMLQFNSILERSKGLGKAIRRKNEKQEKEAQARKQAEKLELRAQKNMRALMKAPSKAVWTNSQKTQRGHRHK